jgi:hypothetical protein
MPRVTSRFGQVMSTPILFAIFGITMLMKKLLPLSNLSPKLKKSKKLSKRRKAVKMGQISKRKKKRKHPQKKKMRTLKTKNPRALFVNLDLN